MALLDNLSMGLMRTSSNSKASSNLEMETEIGDEFLQKNCSKLLELAAMDDLPGFVSEVEEKGCDVGEIGIWYGRAFGSKKIALDERASIWIASLCGSIEVLKYILGTGKVDVNRSCGSDGATPLHCAAASGSWSSVEVVKLLIDAGADIDAVDVNGRRPGDVIASCVKYNGVAKRRELERMLGSHLEGEGGAQVLKEEGSEKKGYPVDTSLPDISNGVYGTDEFRMYSFKVTPCCRAYSHDWTECPFAHPGENARRRDPRKFHYTCVPCPEFKKASCGKGDSCEYAHGVFESWLHPAQYRTRLCKDETGCSRKVCFFAHKRGELRLVPSPMAVAMNSLESTMLSTLTIVSPSLNGFTSPMSPSGGACLSPMGGSTWTNNPNLTPPALQLPGSRLKATFSARNIELEMGSLSSPYNRIGEIRPANLDDAFGSIDPTLFSQLYGLSPKANNARDSISQSPFPQNQNQNQSQLRASYPLNVQSSPSRGYGFDSATIVMNSRSSAMTRRSQSFIHCSGGGGYPSMGSSNSPSCLSEWGSPNGKLDWGFSSEEANKLRKSASFGVGRCNASPPTPTVIPVDGGIVDGAPVNWIDQMYIEQEQIVA